MHICLIVCMYLWMYDPYRDVVVLDLSGCGHQAMVACKETPVLLIAM